MHDELHPPDWALAEAERLSLEGFGHAFIASWRNTRARLLKFEFWQTYQEPATKSLHEYERGNFSAVGDLLEAEADLDEEVYEGTRNGPPLVRIRLVKLPLTAYLTFEMWNYVVRAHRGETIEIVDLSADERPLPNHRYFDFLLFDETIALIHDYGVDGRQTGGWSTTSRDTIRRLAAVGEQARQLAAPLATFMTRHQITIPG